MALYGDRRQGLAGRAGGRGLTPATVYCYLSRLASCYQWAAQDPALASRIPRNPVRLGEALVITAQVKGGQYQSREVADPAVQAALVG